MIERRSGRDRRKYDDDSCPMTPECVERLRLEIKDNGNRLKSVEVKVDELCNKLLHARGFVSGMRAGAGLVLLFAGSFVMMIWGLLSGRISLRDILGFLS